MFTTPAVDLVGLAAAFGETGSFDRWRSRVRKLPEFGGELPISVLAEEIETPGKGQIRGLITVAGNPVLSAPNGTRLEKVLASLDFMVSVDFYLNETTRHARLILPPTFALEREHYDLLLNALAVRDVARYSPPLFRPDPGALHDWQILLELATRIARKKGGVTGWSAALRSSLFKRWTPRRLLDLSVRLGPHGSFRNPFGKALSLKSLLRAHHTVDLGELKPEQFPGRLYTNKKKIALAPGPMLQHLRSVPGYFLEKINEGQERLLLIGRRHMLDNNSWMHNCDRLVRGPDRCTLLMNEADAATRRLRTGQLVRIRSRVGSITAPLEVTDAIMEGVVSLPHGFGHNREATRLRTAQAHPGVSVNDITDDALVDELTGTSCLNGVPVHVEAAEAQE